MRASFVYISIFLALTLAASGCKSPTAVSAPYVTITPPDFRGAEFASDTFKAQIFNHDVAQTYFEWDMGDNTIIYGGPDTAINSSVTHSFKKPGKYTVTVHAFDNFSHTVIATAFTQIIIDTVKSSVKIIPQFYNGLLPMNNFGLIPFSLSVKTTLPSNEIYTFWNYGDSTIDSFTPDTVQHIFPHPGTYLLKCNVYQKSGSFIGSDTATITINYPFFNLADFKIGRVEAYLVIDSTSPFFNAANNYLPLSFGMPLVNSNWQNNKFFANYISGVQRYFISGSIAASGELVDSFEVSAQNDSVVFKYQATNLKLIAVTDNFLVYKISGENSKNNLSEIYFKGTIGNAGFVSDPPQDFIDLTTTPIPPQCILVLSKK